MIHLDMNGVKMHSGSKKSFLVLFKQVITIYMSMCLDTLNKDMGKEKNVCDNKQELRMGFLVIFRCLGKVLFSRTFYGKICIVGGS